MPDRYHHEPLALTVGDAALLIRECLLVSGALESMLIGDRPENEPLPRGVLTCGEAWRLIPACACLLFDRFPQLVDPDTFNEALRTAKLHSACGSIN